MKLLYANNFSHLLLGSISSFWTNNFFPCGSLQASQSGIIAEHKRRSPSKQNINSSLSVTDVAQGYEDCWCLRHVGFDRWKIFWWLPRRFNPCSGSNQFSLYYAKNSLSIEYQLIEAKAHGADVILLIASVLTRNEIQQLSTARTKFGFRSVIRST